MAPMGDLVARALAAILALSGGRGPSGPPGFGALDLAVVVAQEAGCHEVDVEVVVAVMFRESGFRVGEESPAGDHGLMQVRRGVSTRGYDWLTERQIHEPAINVHLGTRRLSWARAACGGAGPELWLGHYAGVARRRRDGTIRCVRTRYARRVLAEVESL